MLRGSRSRRVLRVVLSVPIVFSAASPAPAPGGAPVAIPSWTKESPDILTLLGFSVGAAGDTDGDGHDDLIVGAPREGLAYVWRGAAAGPGTAASWQAGHPYEGSDYGYSVAWAGDVNGDGYDDVVAGEPFHVVQDGGEGAAFLYFGSSRGLSILPAWSVTGAGAGAWLGSVVGTAGDVDRDGYDDLLVGAMGIGEDSEFRATAYLYRGSRGGPGASPVWSVAGEQPGSPVIGTWLSGAGDVNGDGYADVIVGTHFHGNGETNEGRADLYLGSPSGPGPSPDWTAEGNAAGALFGMSVGSAGDTDGDGYGDVLIGAPGLRKVFVYRGSAQGLGASPPVFLEGRQAGSRFGEAAAAAGDVNGDGYGDVVVGAKFHDGAQPDGGRIELFLGSPSGPFPIPVWAAEGGLPGGRLGSAVASAGDVNADGFDDVVAGAPNCATSVLCGKGRVHLFLGSAMPDSDGDRYPDRADNCPAAPNADQADGDADGAGDACDVCPGLADPAQEDADGDAVGDACDVCPEQHDPGQENSDGDAEGGDACDITVTHPLAPEDAACGGDPPVVRWTPETYRRFRVYVGWDPAFSRGGRVTSGGGWLTRTRWQVPAKKWVRACSAADPVLYIKVLGRAGPGGRAEESEIVAIAVR
jgi:hypothetical protein